MLPTFIVIGAAKSGTSSLSSYLRGHPDVFMTEPKEPHFFSRGHHKGLAHYEALFAGAGEAKARGEASTSYSQAPTFDGVPARIAAAVPDVRLIYLLRNPVDRIRSQYVHYVDRGREGRPFAQAVTESSHYLDGSRYAYQLELYLEHFDRDQALVLSSDQLRTDREAAMRDVFEFVGVDPDAPIRTLERELNRSADKRRAPAAVDAGRRFLRRSGLGRRVPRSLRVRAHHLASRPMKAETSALTPELAERLWGELADDLHRLRALVGPGMDLWGRA